MSMGLDVATHKNAGHGKSRTCLPVTCVQTKEKCRACCVVWFDCVTNLSKLCRT